MRSAEIVFRFYWHASQRKCAVFVFPLPAPTKKKGKKSKKSGGCHCVAYCMCHLPRNVSKCVDKAVRNGPEEACGVDPGIRRMPVSHWTDIIATSLTPLARLPRRKLLRDMISTQEPAGTLSTRKCSAWTLNPTKKTLVRYSAELPARIPGSSKKRRKETRITPPGLTYRYPYYEQPGICQTCACTGG